MKKRRLLIAVTTAMAMVILLSKPAFLNVYAKSYKPEEITIVSTVLQEGDKLLFPEWGYKTQGMLVRYFNEKNALQQNVNVEPGEDYVIPAYESLDISDPLPAGQKFAGWSVTLKPEQSGGMQWDLRRCLRPEPEETSKPTQAPEPTDTPTTAPEPTDTPTTAPVPTDTPTTAPEPTDTPTTAPVPTDTPTTAPVPTAAPTATAVPTTAPVATAVPTTAPTAAPTATAVPTTVPTAAPTATAVPTTAPVVTAVPTTAPIPTDVPTTAPVPTQTPTAVPQPTTTPDSTPAPTLVPTPTPEPDIPNTVISQAGTYELQPYMIYLLKGSVSHVEGDITNYANPISFTVSSSGTYTFY